MIWGSMFGNGEEASEAPVETGEESAGLEAGLPLWRHNVLCLWGTPLVSSPVIRKHPS